MPQNPKTYIHRVGRSARAGRFGCALVFVTQYDIFLLQEIEKVIGKKVEKLVVNDKKVIIARFIQNNEIQFLDQSFNLIISDEKIAST